MDTSWLALLGVATLAVVMLDVIWSTLSASGAGPISLQVAGGVWRIALAIHRRRESHTLLHWTAPAAMIAIFTCWVALLWLGWLFIFASAPEAVIDATTGVAAAPLDRVYYVGFTIFTLGVGDFVGGSSIWRVITSLASLNGLLMVTLGITYLLQVLDGATIKRSLATRIDGLGSTAEEIVVHGWDGDGFGGLESQLVSLPSAIVLHAERHLTYPVLHYFHAAQKEAALPPKIAALDDAVTLLGECVAPEHRPPASLLRSLRHAIDTYTERVETWTPAIDPDVPATPRLLALHRVGVPLVDETSMQQAFEARQERRKALLGMVRGDGWTWNSRQGLA